MTIKQKPRRRRMKNPNHPKTHQTSNPNNPNHHEADIHSVSILSHTHPPHMHHLDNHTHKKKSQKFIKYPLMCQAMKTISLTNKMRLFALLF